MNFKEVLCFGLCFTLPAFAGNSGSVESVFKRNKVKLIKTEVVEKKFVYTVELPFDPSIKNNSNQLETEIAAANGCKSFSLISVIDEVEIRISAKKSSKGACEIEESIEDLPKAK